MNELTLGQFLKQAREDRNYTLRVVEDLTAISNSYLSQLESDKIKQPSPISLHKLSDKYEVSYATLLALAGYPVPDENAIAKAQSVLAARIGAVTRGEEDELVEYLQFIRSRRNSSRRTKR